jgi:hypothetical protein
VIRIISRKVGEEEIQNVEEEDLRKERRVVKLQIFRLQRGAAVDLMES